MATTTTTSLLSHYFSIATLLARKKCIWKCTIVMAETEAALDFYGIKVDPILCSSWKEPLTSFSDKFEAILACLWPYLFHPWRRRPSVLPFIFPIHLYWYSTEVLFLDNSKVFFSAGEANLSCKMRPFSVIYQHSDYPYYSVTTFPLLWLLVKATMFARRCQSFLKAFGTINSTAKMIIELVKKALLSLLIWSWWLFFPMKWF